MKVREVARRLRLDASTVLRLIHDGQLQATRPNGWARRFDVTEEALDAFIEHARIKPNTGMRS